MPQLVILLCLAFFIGLSFGDRFGKADAFATIMDNPIECRITSDVFTHQLMEK